MANSLKRSELLKRHALLTELLRKNTPVCEALLEAGYSEKQAHKGWESVPQAVTAQLLSKGVKHQRMGKALQADKDGLSARVVGRMYERMMDDGKDCVNAAKVLTTHRSIASDFIQEQQNNIVVIQAPSDWKAETLDKPEPKQLTKLPALPEYE